jgi:hypothetical protein
MNPAMIRYRAFAVLLFAAALSSCDKNAVQDIAGAPPGARIRFFNFGVNAPAVNFYANNTKMTAVLSGTGVESTTGVTYGNVGAGGLYAGIAPGQYTFSGKISATTDKDVAISNVQATVEMGKNYSFYQSGFYNTTTKTVEAFIVEDPFINEFDYSVAYVRFVNAISNSNPMALFVTSTTTPPVETAIGGAAAYKAASAFVAIPGGAYDLATRYVGSTTNAITRTAVSFSAGRIYTVTALGDITVTSSTATNRARLDNTLNR